MDRIHQQAGVFCIDICAYAVMSNHYHLVLHVNRASGESLPDEEVVKRWLTLFGGPVLIRRYQQDEAMSSAELSTVRDIIGVWRERLCDISWFMRCLNELIARRANKEDQCTGRFWEGRFKSQAVAG